MTKKLFTLLLAVAASVGTMFASTKIGDLYYNLDATNQTAEVARNSSASGEIIIPSSVTYNSMTYSVTSIGSYAFWNCTGLTSVTIPNSVTSIGSGAFYGCSGLTSPVYNAHVFAFMPTSYSGAYTIADGIESIGGSAFSGCSGLTSVTIPNSVTSIGNYVFSDCSGLTSISIPESVTSIGSGAFYHCTGLTSIDVATDNPNYCSAEGVLFNKDKSTIVAFLGTKQGKYTIPNSVTSIGIAAFEGCSGLTSIEIPNSVTSIGIAAFASCSGLTSIEIPNSVTSIGDDAFKWCTGLTSVTIPNSVTSIGNYAFWNCTGLTSVTIPNSVTSIGEGAFSGCSGLTSVTIPNSVTSIGGFAFEYCTGLPVTDNIRYADTYLVGAVDRTLSSYTIKEETRFIGSNAFYGCSGLTSVSIPNSVTSIGNHAFWDCNGLTSVTIPNSVTSIAGYAFSGCSGLTSVTIPNSVTSIGYRAFRGCNNLISVTINAETPPTLNGETFDDTNDCPIYVPCGTLETYKSVWLEYMNQIKYAPYQSPKFSTIADHGQIAIAALDDYADATICESAYYYSLSVTPDYGYHFTQWSDGLKDNPRIVQITSQDATTFIAEFAYDRVGTCGKDLALVWSYDPTKKVLTIGNAGSFTENMQFGVEAPNEMEELVIGNSITAIGANAFADIETLKKVSIGESVKTIGEQAFFNCVNLETIFNYRPTPTNTYSNAFDGVDKFECTLYVLPSSIDMYKAAAVWRDFYYTYAIGAKEATVTTNDVKVEPQDNAATLTWPMNDNAASYTIQITKDGVVFCTLIFNANGQLTGIAFAPSREGSHHAPAAIMTANGLQFTVTGLDSNTQYGYNLTAKDANNQTVATYSGSFTTTSEGIATGVEEVSSSLQGGDRGRLILHNGQIYILRGEKVYSIDGQEVR